MKKHFSIILTITLCSVLSKGSYGQELKTEEIAEVKIPLDLPIAAGTKIIYPIKGGRITGKITGKFLPVGADFGTLISPTTYKLDVREVIQTDDSATIYVTIGGYIYADVETFKLLASGKAKEVNPDKYYFRLTPVYETTSPKYEWLNHTVAIGVGVLTETGVSYKVYAVK
jgi:hypothetical protein